MKFVGEGSDPGEEEDLCEADPTDDGCVGCVHAEGSSNGIDEGGDGVGVSVLEGVAEVDGIDFIIVPVAKTAGSVGVVD